MAACRGHSPEVAGSSPAPATRTLLRVCSLGNLRRILPSRQFSGGQILFCSFPVRTKLQVALLGSIAQSVEHSAVNRNVAGSNPVASAFRDVVQSGRTLGLGPRSRKFESCHSDFASIAQLAEQLICNQQVIGSNPIRSSCGRWVAKIWFSSYHFVVRRVKEKEAFGGVLRKWIWHTSIRICCFIRKITGNPVCHIWRDIEAVITRRP